MNGRRSLLGLTFCTCYLASHLTNKYVLSVLKFTYPTLFQGWQTLIGGLLLHASWKLGWVEINSSLRSHVLAWLPASVLFVGIIYAGSRALSRLAVPVFFILHNVAEVLICGYQKCVGKEKTSPTKICSALFLVAAAGCLPFQDAQFDPDGYFWAVVHLFCVGAYKILRKSQKPSVLSDIDQQYLNYIFSGALGFFLTLSTVKLKSILAPGQCAAWIFFAKVITAGLSLLLFDVILTSATVGWLPEKSHLVSVENMKAPSTHPGTGEFAHLFGCLTKTSLWRHENSRDHSEEVCKTKCLQCPESCGNHPTAKDEAVLHRASYQLSVLCLWQRGLFAVLAFPGHTPPTAL
ncbi:transmembrane protein 241 isoform X6 [Mesocricetus auratus]|uniref:Transmembrane protein 241 isoform X6 n=1 Tax=Mesocricetus auratus TaxID=10036 RepID=A0ABM2YG54_MESAU|nr:transmembrane protein 241 isoform X6 [Mesocricetus auratus]